MVLLLRGGLADNDYILGHIDRSECRSVGFSNICEINYV